MRVASAARADRLLAKELRSNPDEELEELRERAEGALTGPSLLACLRARRQVR